MTARIARVAGHLLARVGSGSEMAVNALVVATAVGLAWSIEDFGDAGGEGARMPPAGGG